MAKDISGTPISVSLDGTSYRVTRDANFTDQVVEYTNEMLATSGRGMRKKTKKIPVVESVTLSVNSDEREQIRGFNDQDDDITLAYTNAAGDVFRNEGTINVEGLETENNTLTITMQPRGSWTAFIA